MGKLYYDGLVMKHELQKCLWYGLGIIFLFLPSVIFAAQTKLSAVHVNNADTSAQVTFTLTQPVHAHVFALSHPDRLVIDLENTRLATDFKNVYFINPAIQMLRSGYPRPSLLRLVMDVNLPIHVKYVLRNKQIILNIYFEKHVTTNLPIQKIIKPTKIVKPIIVVVDAGHGGKDYGAKGVYGTKEKDVVLAIAKKLAALINEQPNMRAVLTRTGDYYVSLRDRLRLARKGKADLFVAIHADAYFTDRATGASVYALSQHGATSEAAHWLARRDNYSELGNVDLGELEDQSYLVRSVLIDLAQTATITESLRLGTSMLDALDEIERLHYTRVEQAPFMVLKSPDIPSILVETGFISNEQEELRLRNQEYQNKLAQTMFDGIHLYLKKYASTSV